MNKLNSIFVSLFLITTLSAQNTPLFTTLTTEKTGVTFKNQLTETQEHSALIFDNFYGGGGVAIGDINNDDLPDIYFAGNQVGDELYVNKGKLRFQNATEKAGILNRNTWTTGVVMADVNGDGWLDIYVCKAVYEESETQRENEFYLNNGDGTFQEVAAKWGINSNQRSQQASFLDYDRDGDLDLFLVNQPPNPGILSGLKGKDWRSTQFSSQLFENQGDTFIEATEKAGVQTDGFGLSVSVADYNNDYYPDIYMSCDYNSPDRLFINQKDGTFKNTLPESMAHTSFFAMGTDAADFNNDGLIDLAVLDMVAEDNYRLKANMGGMEPEAFWQTVEEGGHYQYMFNTLQLNRGVNGDGTTIFSDIAQMAGTAYSDWSWSPLIADFDNDGYKDLFCTNGLVRDLRNTDANTDIRTYINAAIQKFQIQNPTIRDANIWDIVDWKVVLDMYPSQKLPNYMFKNKGNLSFDKVAEEWGLAQPSFSTGAAYGDLDKDGDLDLVVNNLNDKPFIYQNNSKQNYLRIVLKNGEKQGIHGVRVSIRVGEETQFVELTDARGFYSSSEPVVHFGIGAAEKVDVVNVYYQKAKVMTKANVKANKVMEFDIAKAAGFKGILPRGDYFFKTEKTKLTYQENDFNDFDREVLLPHRMSQMGPALAIADVNGDGREDVYLGGAKDQVAQLFLQQENGQLKAENVLAFTIDQDREDVDALFFDADGDGDQDLYVVSGSNEEETGSYLYQDRFYENKNGNLSSSPDALPDFFESGGVVTAADYDGDGDQDLFVGGRQMPGQYPSPANSFLLKNEWKEQGEIKFSIAQSADFQSLGMVTSAVWVDIDNDKDQDLIIAGEWMPITTFRNEGGTLKKEITNGLTNSNGWWNTLTTADLDGDGDQDIIAGNLGKNYKFKASKEEPFSVYYEDFDENGSMDIVLSYYNFGKEYPVRGRSCSSQQVPTLAEEFPTYDQFASSDIFQVYGEENLEKSLHLEAYQMASVWLENEGIKGFTVHELPIEAQLSSTNAILAEDFNEDGHVDLLLGGNLYGSEVETPRADASIGCLLIGDGMGNFTAIPALKSGLYLEGEVRHVVPFEKNILVGANQVDKLQLLRK